jgi:uroporphyrinogen-III decarboxylase
MEQKKGAVDYLFKAEAKAGVEIDPADPKTWFLAATAEGPQGIDVSAQMHDHAMMLAGVPAKKFYYDPLVNANVSSAASAYYRFDAPSVGFDAYNYEAEAMGQKMIYGENAMPTIDFREPLVSGPDDLAKIKPPDDWFSAGRIRFALDLCNYNMELGYGRGMFCAPFSLAVGVRSYPKLIRDMRKNPPFAHELFTRLVDDVLPSYLKVQKEYCGAEISVGADAWAAFPNLTPEMVEEWVVPYAMKLLQNCMQFGVTALCVAGGDYCEEDLSRFDKEILWKTFDAQVKVAAGAPSFILGMGRWQDYPLEAVAEYLERYKAEGVRATVMGGINGRLLRDGPVEAIVDNVKRFVDILGRDHNLSIFLANIPADAPSGHVHAAVAATHAYGRKPLAEDLDSIEVDLTKRESFQEYVDQMSGGLGLQF